MTSMTTTTTTATITPTPPITGPAFQFVEEIDACQLGDIGGFGARTQPLLVKGALHQWPAQQQWSFEQMAALRYRDGSEPVIKFQNGLVEQGQTRPRPDMPIGPYLRELAASAGRPSGEEAGLLPLHRKRALMTAAAAAGATAPFHLDWSYMQSFTPDRMYLAQWNILDEFPALRRDFAIKNLWPGRRWTWEYVFVGPAHTVTGLHYDFPHNWFCQVRGTKEFILFTPDQSPHLSVAKKYDWGATLSEVDISRLDGQPGVRERFAQARGLYARVEAGDALFIPKRTWHAVVALEPSISIGIFGLTPGEILIGGGIATARDLLHRVHLYRWGNCTCHKALPGRGVDPRGGSLDALE